MIHGLTQNDVADFERLTEIVTRHYNNAIKSADLTGSALIEIRDRRLYRVKYKSFEDFCEQVLGRSKPHVHRLIAFEKAKLLTGDPPDNEHQARTERSENANPSTKSDSQPNGASGTKSESKPKARKNTSEDETPPREDCTGYIIPEQWVALFDRAGEVKALRQKVSEVRCALNKAQENKDLLFSSISISIVVSELDVAYAGLEDGIPYSVCPYCQGQTADFCRCCKGRGLISKRYYDDACDKDLIRIREQVISERRKKEAA